MFRRSISFIITFLLQVSLPFNSILAQICPSSNQIYPSSRYFDIIEEKVYSTVEYPQEALRKGWEGIVKVKFVIDQSGQVQDVFIAESSGYPLLDAEAMYGVRDASPYPFPQEYRGEENVEITVPVRFVQPEPSQKTETMVTPVYTEGTGDNAKRDQEEPYLSDTEIAEGIPSVDTLTEMYQKEVSSDDTVAVEGIKFPSNQLQNFVHVALNNNQPTMVAAEEVRLARIKVSEAQRNFFPQAKVTAYNTQGETYKIDYEEHEVKLQLDQPLYYGGRLGDTLKQSKANLEITKRNYDRLAIDVMHKTETSFYNLSAAILHLQEKTALKQESADLLQKIEKLAGQGLIIQLELNSARAWNQQLNFQIESIKHDLHIAELTFKQVLNTPEVPDFVPEIFDPEEIGVEVEDFVAVAMKKRPELYLSELLVKFNEYGQKIEKAKKEKLTLDLVTSYGYYEGHYRTEPWGNSENLYGGIKASIPWEASTLNTSVSYEKSQPRFGQTSPTQSKTISGEFNILDNYKRLTDKQRADIDLKRAISDLNETAKTVAFEVQDAFLNYQKAYLQLKTAESDMKYRRNESQVIKVRAQVGEASLSNAIESLYSYSEAQSRYYQALANCQISLANLKKACGYGLSI